MALTKCPECEKEISDKAESCPHCGKALKEASEAAPKATVKKPAEKSNVGVIVAVVLGVVLLGVGIFFIVKNGGGGAPAHSIVCSQTAEEDGTKTEANLTFGFNDEENKLKTIGIKAKYEFADASTVESYMSLLKYMGDPCQVLVSSLADGAKFSKCDLKSEGSKITIDAYSDDLSGMNESDLTGSMSETKKALEQVGYSCK